MSELLDCDEFMSELRNDDEPTWAMYLFISLYRLNADRINQLLNYIVVKPTKNDNKDRAFKYPFYASQIFQLDIKPIIETLFIKEGFDLTSTGSAQSIEGKDSNLILEDAVLTPRAEDKKSKLLEKLFSFVGTKDELNPMLAGYFFKIFSGISSVCKNDLLEYLFQFNNHIDNMIKHVHNRSISATLQLILGYTRNDQFKEEKKKVIEKLVERLESVDKEEAAMNISWILGKVIAEKEHLEYLMSKETVEKLFKSVYKNTSLCLKGVLNIIVNITKNLPQPNVENSDSQTPNQIPDMKPVLQQSIKFLPTAKKLLEDKNKAINVYTTYGNDLNGLGIDKLYIIEWLQALIAMKDDMVIREVKQLKIAELLLSLMKRHYMNSILHLKVLKIFEGAIESKIPSYVKAVSTR